VHRITKRRKTRRVSSFGVCLRNEQEEDEDLVCKQANNNKRTNEFRQCRHALPMRHESPLTTMNETGRESPMQKKNFPVCQEGLLSVSPSSNNRKFPVCRDGSVGWISRRVSPCEEEVVCRLQTTNRQIPVCREGSVCRTGKKEQESVCRSPRVGRRVSPAINLEQMRKEGVCLQ